MYKNTKNLWQLLPQIFIYVGDDAYIVPLSYYPITPLFPTISAISASFSAGSTSANLT